jgi:hypothetical protein
LVLALVPFEFLARLLMFLLWSLFELV